MKEKRYDIDRMIMESNYLNSIEKECSNNGGSCAEMERQMYLDIINDLIERVKSQEAKDAENKKFIEEMRRSLEASRKEVKECLIKIEKLEDAKEENDLNKQTIYGSKSQKGTKDKTRSKKKDRDEERDDFDGTSGSVEDKDETDSIEETSDKASSEGEMAEDEDNDERPYRKGMTYNKMKAAKLVYHKCDTTDIPEGYTIFKFVERSEFTRVSYIKEDRFQIAILKNEEGKIKNYYKPVDKDDGKLPCEDTVEGTHATPEFLSDLVVNKYQLQQPFYRELVRMANEKMQICEQTLINWITKGAEYLNSVLPYLRSTLLSKGANLNCDETWCRVRIMVPGDKNGVYRKKYIWVIVNSKEKIVYYLYDDGSRGRKVIKDFLGDFWGSMQTDGYVAYKFFDKEDSKVKHIYCMAHVRAKFKYACEIGKDERARYFLEKIGYLYGKETEYIVNRLSAEKILKERKGEYVQQILLDIEQRAEQLKNDPNAHLGKLMRSAITYMLNGWKQLIEYTNDGNYTIDNSLAERSIRPFTIGRKNFVSFGSEEGPKTAAVYYTFVETCKMRGISPKDYFTDFFRAILTGRRDYEALVPAIIG